MLVGCSKQGSTRRAFLEMAVLATAGFLPSCEQSSVPKPIPYSPDYNKNGGILLHYLDSDPNNIKNRNGFRVREIQEVIAKLMSITTTEAAKYFSIKNQTAAKCHAISPIGIEEIAGEGAIQSAFYFTVPIYDRELVIERINQTIPNVTAILIYPDEADPNNIKNFTKLKNRVTQLNFGFNVECPSNQFIENGYEIRVFNLLGHKCPLEQWERTVIADLLHTRYPVLQFTPKPGTVRTVAEDLIPSDIPERDRYLANITCQLVDKRTNGHEELRANMLYTTKAIVTFRISPEGQTQCYVMCSPDAITPGFSMK